MFGACLEFRQFYDAQVRISTYVVRFNRRGRSTPDDPQDSVNGPGRASLRGVVANAFLTQWDTR